jgi:hypothetical protein
VSIRPLLISLLLVAALAPAAGAQGMPEQFSSGNEYFPVEIYMGFVGQGERATMIFPGEGISGSTFRHRPDGGPGWIDLFMGEGYNALSVDWPGTGASTNCINRDLIRALEAHVEGAYFTARGAMPVLSIAHAEGAALLIKTRSFGDYLSRTSVLIDPVGPQYAQPLEPLSFEQALAHQESFEDELWRRWGFGPRAGELDEGLDIDLEAAMAVFEAYQRDAFPIRPALLQPMISPIRVRGTGRLDGWRVLILRTPAADDAQVARELALTAWLRAANVHVELLDLSTDPELANTTGLPWIGANAFRIQELIMEWHRQALLLVPPLRDLDAGQTPGS